mmetsp:Transcript_31454/g.75909  ORF Transcript_31454/g.75909 Transcript_31454/m.75909 type:complete len:81 (-) Transcript_31454:292-534(-)
MCLTDSGRDMRVNDLQQEKVPVSISLSPHCSSTATRDSHNQKQLLHKYSTVLGIDTRQSDLQRPNAYLSITLRPSHNSTT